MTARQAIGRLRRAKSKGVRSWEIDSRAVGTLRGWGHEISFDGPKGREGIYRLEKDACVCTRCGETSVKPRKSFMCDFCSIELGLMEEPKLKPPPGLHCPNGHPKVLGNVSHDGRCLICEGRRNLDRQVQRRLERAERAA